VPSCDPGGDRPRCHTIPRDRALSLPRIVTTERRYLDHERTHALAAECDQYRLVVLFLAYTGVRFGEMAALGDELVFPNSLGTPMRSQVFQRAALTKGAAAIGVPGLHPHELRHTAASLAIASGADVKVVQQMLGQKSATMTLDLYGHLFGDRLDEVADRLDAAATAALASARVYPMRASITDRADPATG